MFKIDNEEESFVFDKSKKRFKLIIFVIILLSIFLAIKESYRYSTSQKIINVEVLSTKTIVKSVTQPNKTHDNIEYIYITFEYDGYRYDNFELGEKKNFLNLKNHDNIKLVLHKEYKDNQSTNEFINTYWYNGGEAKRVN